MEITLVFVHGWSVTNLDTYGELPLRLKTEAAQQNVFINIKNIFLGKYISFHDEVQLKDISRAFEMAINDQLKGVERFVCITHSTGGPVVRDWWNRFQSNSIPRVSHLIMLAPANFGSALAQLGKGKLSRLSSFFNGVEPGQGVLDWLSLGSSEAWELNKNWILSNGNKIGPNGIFPFVLTGQSINRKFYDNLNSYTGEIGSDGVVRVAAANLNARYIILEQSNPEKNNSGLYTAHKLVLDETGIRESFKVPLKIVKGKSHSGDEMGIMASVENQLIDLDSADTISSILNCIKVTSLQDYSKLQQQFVIETQAIQAFEKIETEKELFFLKRHFIHDRFCMIIFKIMDTDGNPVPDFDLLLTAGDNSDPNHLPEGFFADRQQNQRHKNTVTYFLNYDVMIGSPAIISEDGKEIRAAQKGINKLGLKIIPRPDKGFVRYLPAELLADKKMFEAALMPNSTTLIEIVLQRIVSDEVFKMTSLINETMPTKKEGDFSKTIPGNNIVNL